ncbi:Uncharacterised protein [Enterocloster clostridioformis]|uniref:Uncharacterized protein n=1 Tax=Enterocloster clostridioformis TaxID=1531 RepID=A0A2X2UGJ4_9FIRM|nr:Uncharacterised protein [Enterocloster clostridioformis]
MENIKGNIIVTELEAEELVEHIGEIQMLLTS